MLDKLKGLIEPIVIEKNLKLYHIEYVNEEGNNYLRIYIDSENGISLEDCEKVSRPVSNLLDIEDPISEGYFLEVSSPGINRQLYTDDHLKSYINHLVKVKLNSLYNDKDTFYGNLTGINEKELILVHDNKEIVLPRNIIETVNLEFEEFKEDNKK
ncbi:MAG: ribosome maturation factor RimP [Bacillota bacterium]|nr:ribosome maturation factor RimP [Bacillota bacterium]